MQVIFANIGMLMFRGGGENFDINLSKALQVLGHTTELYSLRPLLARESLTPPEEFQDVHPLKAPWLYPVTAFFHHYAFLRRLRGLRGIPRLIGQIIFELRVFLALFRRRDEDFVLLTCALPLLTFLTSQFLAKIAIVRMPGPIENFYDRFFSQRSTAIIANGNAYEKIKGIVGCDNLNFVDIGVFEFAECSAQQIAALRASLGIEPSTFLALFVGRCSPIKNIPMLIRAWHVLIESGSSGKLLIVGDGSDLDSLQHLAAELDLSQHIHFMGTKNKAELAALYRAADCCVLPSRYDNFPNVLIESLSCGTPCIGTAVGGIPTIITPRLNGFLVQSENVEELAEALRQMAINGDAFDRIKIQQATRASYGWDKSAAAFLEVINKYD